MCGAAVPGGSACPPACERRDGLPAGGGPDFGEGFRAELAVMVLSFSIGEKESTAKKKPPLRGA